MIERGRIQGALKPLETFPVSFQNKCWASEGISEIMSANDGLSFLSAQRKNIIGERSSKNGGLSVLLLSSTGDGV